MPLIPDMGTILDNVPRLVRDKWTIKIPFPSLYQTGYVGWLRTAAVSGGAIVSSLCGWTMAGMKMKSADMFAWVLPRRMIGKTLWRKFNKLKFSSASGEIFKSFAHFNIKNKYRRQKRALCVLRLFPIYVLSIVCSEVSTYTLPVEKCRATARI